MDVTEQLAAERAIRRRLLEYCRGIDRCDADLVAGVYHPDGTDDHGSFQGLGVDFARYATDALARHAIATSHVIGDSLIDFLDSTTADVETPVTAVHRVRDEASGGEVLERFGGRYFDRFECRDGDWRISERRLTWDWDTLEPIDPAFPPGRFTPSPRSR
jgi:SnoaL-like domain